MTVKATSANTAEAKLPVFIERLNNPLPKRVMNITQLALAYCLAISPLMADSFGVPVPRAFTSEYGTGVVFTMMPAKYGNDHKIIREALGIAYKMDEEGRLKELYRTKGWYSYEVSISMDGRYLVRLEKGPVGDGPSKDQLALAFYKDGKLLKEYSTEEMIKDKSKVLQTTSHYFWTPFPTATEADRPHIDNKDVFSINTIDGWTYKFDVTTGKIKSTRTTEG